MAIGGTWWVIMCIVVVSTRCLIGGISVEFGTLAAFDICGSPLVGL